MKRVLIAGSTGKIGSFLVKALASDYAVYTVSRQRSGINNFRYDFDSQSGDLTPLRNIRFEAIIFCIGILPSSNLSKEAFDKINSKSVGVLAQHVNRKCKFIFMSSISVYGESIVDRTISESDKVSPKNLYAKSKLEGEILSRESFKTCYIFRVPPVYTDFNDKTIYKRIVKNKLFEIKFGDDTQLHSFCSLQNLSVIIKQFSDNHYEEGIFHVADREVLSSKDLKDKLKFKPLVVFKFPKWAFESILLFFNVLNIRLVKNKVNEIYFKLFCSNIYSTDKILDQIERKVR
ncbi:sugar nucleotide-binding protein [Akkermansiaceae bacterium]|nr:sugar nucleotide-binding protein [Akkermansiaceae bacterium]